MAKPDTYRLLLRDVVFELIEEAERARGLRDGLPPGEGKSFQAGVTFGLYGVLSSLTQKAKAFQVQLGQLGLDGIDADSELAHLGV